MTKTIVQKVVFKNTTPKALYELYVNAKKHSLIAGSPATITGKAGDKFSLHGGYITGKNIHLVKDRLIVQTWRAKGWEENDPDSTFIIELEPKGKDVVLHAIHASLPDKHSASVAKGWFEHYWNPWKQHLAGKAITRPTM